MKELTALALEKYGQTEMTEKHKETVRIALNYFHRKGWVVRHTTDTSEVKWQWACQYHSITARDSRDCKRLDK